MKKKKNQATLNNTNLIDTKNEQNRAINLFQNG